jgi:hypothetical protein
MCINGPSHPAPHNDFVDPTHPEKGVHDSVQ